MLDITDLEKRRLRVTAYEDLAASTTFDGERYNAQAMAYRLRASIYDAERTLPVESGRIAIPARAGLGRIRLTLAINAIAKLGGWVSTNARQWSFARNGDASLDWTARADRHARIAAVLPELLDDVDAAALDAARIHRAHLRTLPEEHHHPRDRENLVRAYRHRYMECYGLALITRITLGITPGASPAAAVERGGSPVRDAHDDAASVDTRRYGLAAPPRRIAIAPAP
ncbi:hypothetical protein ACGFJC_47405 [Nonomuraea fuscirosea]|uniref:hypothetical protein n=1 Tax=Nonomuraea fuscirosea TaxID=1291556 RepID=UPI00371DCD64